ncbi:MAG: hypothetical protein ACI8RD_013338, partial [Bacillariaceae sp.]
FNLCPISGAGGKYIMLYDLFSRSFSKSLQIQYVVLEINRQCENSSMFVVTLHFGSI